MYAVSSYMHLEQVRQGFEELVPRQVLEQTFSARELEAVLTGSGDVDVADWRANSVATGFRPSAPQVFFFFNHFARFFFFLRASSVAAWLSPLGSTGFFFLQYGSVVCVCYAAVASVTSTHMYMCVCGVGVAVCV